MLGTRGVRLGLLHPEVYETQARAIFRGGARCGSAPAGMPRVEIMIPLVAYARELELARDIVMRVSVEEGFAAGDFARQAEVFSFGTNDL
jgi:pyruvate,orthophosphate dikinase